MQISTLTLAVLVAFASGQSSVAQNLGNDLAANGSSRGAYFKPANSLSLGRFTQTNDTLAMIGDESWREVLRKGGLNVFQQGNGSYRAEMNARNLALPQKEQELFERAGLQPEFETAQVYANLDYSGQQAGSGTLRGLDLEKFNLTLGDISISGFGKMEKDQANQMQGQAAVTVVNWRKLLAVLDLPNESLRPQIEAGIAGLAQGDSVDLTITIKDGSVMYGPLTLAKIPEI